MSRTVGARHGYARRTFDMYHYVETVGEVVGSLG